MLLSAVHGRVPVIPFSNDRGITRVRLTKKDPSSDLSDSSSGSSDCLALRERNSMISSRLGFGRIGDVACCGGCLRSRRR